MDLEGKADAILSRPTQFFREEENKLTPEINAYYPHVMLDICGEALRQTMEQLPGFRAHGPDGLRYEHLKAMTTLKVEQETREEVVRGLTLLLEEMVKDPLPIWLMQL